MATVGIAVVVVGAGSAGVLAAAGVVVGEVAELAVPASQNGAAAIAVGAFLRSVAANAAQRSASGGRVLIPFGSTAHARPARWRLSRARSRSPAAQVPSCEVCSAVARRVSPSCCPKGNPTVVAKR